MRAFVATHPAYARDSVVPAATAHDLLARCQAVGDGSAPAEDLLGPGDDGDAAVGAGALLSVPLPWPREARGEGAGEVPPPTLPLSLSCLLACPCA